MKIINNINNNINKIKLYSPLIELKLIKNKIKQLKDYLKCPFEAFELLKYMKEIYSLISFEYHPIYQLLITEKNKLKKAKIDAQNAIFHLYSHLFSVFNYNNINNNNLIDIKNLY